MSNNTTILDAISVLDSAISNPTVGLPQDIFLFISRNTPMINVDLLIKNEQGHTLLTWRDDEYYTGWHIPGGIIRYKELAGCRIKAVAKKELNTTVDFEPYPIFIKELICDRANRGHFISMLYKCSVSGALDESLKCADLKNPKPNEWAWHNGCPDNLLEVHRAFERFI